VPLGVSVWHINGLAAGGGTLWFGDVGTGRVWEVGGTPPQVIRSIAVGLNPLGLAYGQGSLWVANAGDGTVMRIDPEKGDVVATIKIGGTPVGIAVDSATVWVTVD
jgi:YVTN family beta-propeller protein